MPGLALLFMLGLSRWLPSKWRPFALAFLIAFLHIAHLLATFRVQLPYWGIG
jgi:hypothetical protein